MKATAVKATIYLHPDALAEIRDAASNGDLGFDFELSCAALKHATDLRYKKIMQGRPVNEDSVMTASAATEQIQVVWFSPVKQLFSPGGTNNG